VVIVMMMVMATELLCFHQVETQCNVQPVRFAQCNLQDLHPRHLVLSEYVEPNAHARAQLVVGQVLAHCMVHSLQFLTSLWS